MDPKIQYQKDATVLAASGQQVGSLSRVVLSPDTRTITDILVRVGNLFGKEEKVVPIEYVAETTEDQITLHPAAGLLEDFPPFEERHLVDANDYADQPPPSGHTLPAIYGHPDVSLSMMNSPTGKKLVPQTTQNIPNGAIAMKKGSRVITAEGTYVGNVERVLAGPEVEQITHLLISSAQHTKETKLIPIHWVMMMDGEKVELRVKQDMVERLADASIPT
ncbi:MAG: PRC-barrel domain-containing protein [Anaerolineales bacterium]|jgi:sporulation protein YlmC with PRC-barrel domain|nr:PRC-barrel domain-containing protein [Anaerolineales bacterium]